MTSLISCSAAPSATTHRKKLNTVVISAGAGQPPLASAGQQQHARSWQ